MALLTKNKFEQLANKRGNYCVSVYIPTERTGENKKGKLMLKNQLAEIEAQLVELKVETKEIGNLLEPIKKLVDDSNFWRHLSDTLVVFSDSEDFTYLNLPIDAAEFSMVSDRYFVLPLLSMFNNNDKFFILTLSQNKNKLYEATQHEVAEIVTEDELPGNILDSVGRDFEQKALQFRSGQTTHGAGLFHGQGAGKDDKQKEIEKYLQDIDNGLNELIDGYSSPLVVAAVDHIFSMFKEISKNKNIYPEPVSGNYDNDDILLVHEKACQILSPWFEKERKQNKENYRENHGKTVSDIEELAKAAIAGSIETVFIAQDKNVWGKVGPEKVKIEVHKEKQAMDICLLDFIARSTFLKRGEVFIVKQEDLPDSKSTANGLLRY